MLTISDIIGIRGSRQYARDVAAIVPSPALYYAREGVYESRFFSSVRLIPATLTRLPAGLLRLGSFAR
jgi:hypothetical protein